MQDHIERYEGIVLDPASRLGDIVPGIRLLGGAPNPAEMPALFASTIGRRLPSRWAEVADLTIADLQRLPAVGDTKIKRFLAYLDGLAGSPIPKADPANLPDISRALVQSVDQAHGPLIALATEAVERDVPDLLTAIEVLLAPGLADGLRERVADIPLPKVEVPDWRADLASLRSSIDERSFEILEARVLMETRREPLTLQELADRYGITRERVRQLEVAATKALVAKASESRFVALRHARRKVGELGVAFPLPDLALPLDADEDRRLLLWLTGPYRLDEGWAVAVEYDGLAGVAGAAFDDVAIDGVATEFEFIESIVDLGVNRDYARVVAGSLGVEQIEDQVIRPARSIGERAAQRLRVIGRPMSIAEFLELEGGGRSRAAVAQAVQAYKGIVRTGKDRYALAEWGDSEYPRILPAMVERLGKHGAASIAELAVELEEEYGVSRASVQMYATLHPKFLAEDGMVRVRPADQPYQPQEDLTASANCYLVDGSWAVRLQVDRDLLRGAGRFIPEAFAVHLGARPLEKGQLHGPFGEISIGWDMTPSLGSIRREAQQLDLRTGDFLFVRRWSSASLDFTGLKKSDLEGKPDEARIKLLAGATTQDPRPWPLVLAEAIGIGAATAPDPADLLGRLRVRGDRDLITLVESLVGSI